MAPPSLGTSLPDRARPRPHVSAVVAAARAAPGRRPRSRAHRRRRRRRAQRLGQDAPRHRRRRRPSLPRGPPRRRLPRLGRPPPRASPSSRPPPRAGLAGRAGGYPRWDWMRSRPGRGRARAGDRSSSSRGAASSSSPPGSTRPCGSGSTPPTTSAAAGPSPATARPTPRTGTGGRPRRSRTRRPGQRPRRPRPRAGPVTPTAPSGRRSSAGLRRLGDRWPLSSRSASPSSSPGSSPARPRSRRPLLRPRHRHHLPRAHLRAAAAPHPRGDRGGRDRRARRRRHRPRARQRRVADVGRRRPRDGHRGRAVERQLLVIQAGVQSVFIVALVADQSGRCRAGSTPWSAASWRSSSVRSRPPRRCGGRARRRPAPCDRSRRPCATSSPRCGAATGSSRGRARGRRVPSRARSPSCAPRRPRGWPSSGRRSCAGTRRAPTPPQGLVVPLDRCVRNLRVLARRASVAVARPEDVPERYIDLVGALADAADDLARVLDEHAAPSAARTVLGRVAGLSARVDPTCRALGGDDPRAGALHGRRPARRRGAGRRRGAPARPRVAPALRPSGRLGAVASARHPGARWGEWGAPIAVGPTRRRVALVAAIVLVAANLRTLMASLPPLAEACAPTWACRARGWAC